MRKYYIYQIVNSTGGGCWYLAGSLRSLSLSKLSLLSYRFNRSAHGLGLWAFCVSARCILLFLRRSLSHFFAISVKISRNKLFLKEKEVMKRTKVTDYRQGFKEASESPALSLTKAQSRVFFAPEILHFDRKVKSIGRELALLARFLQIIGKTRLTSLFWEGFYVLLCSFKKESRAENSFCKETVLLTVRVFLRLWQRLKLKGVSFSASLPKQAENNRLHMWDFI